MSNLKTSKKMSKPQTENNLRFAVYKIEPKWSILLCENNQNLILHTFFCCDISCTKNKVKFVYLLSQTDISALKMAYVDIWHMILNKY